MARSKKDYINVRLGGKTLLAVLLYSVIMIGIGASMKSCQDAQSQSRTKITNVKTK